MHQHPQLGDNLDVPGNVCVGRESYASGRRAAEAVMKLNAQLAQVVRETDTTFTLADLDERFQTLIRHLEDAGVCRRGEPYPSIISKEQWLQAQRATVQKLAKGGIHPEDIYRYDGRYTKAFRRNGLRSEADFEI